MNKIVAIDGPTASGKGTLAKKNRKSFQFTIFKHWWFI